MTLRALMSRGVSFVGYPAKTLVARATAAVYVAILAVVVIWLTINGPALQQAADRLRAEQIDQENTLYCERLGITSGTDNFDKCAGYLQEIRRRQTDRINADSIL
jgi:hypothetical protein